MSGPWGLITSAVNAIGNMYSSNDRSLKENQLNAAGSGKVANLRYATPVQQDKDYTGPGKTAGDISEAMARGMGVIGGDMIRNQILKPALEGEKAIFNSSQAPVAGAYTVSTGPYSSANGELYGKRSYSYGRY